MPRECYYCHGDGTKLDGITPCPVCGGTGEDPNWREKPCAICGQTIEYRIDWNNPPNICQECRERKRGKWRERPCEICGRPVRFHISWDKPPRFCKECWEKKKREWKQRPCAICGKTIRYHIDWKNPPTICKECRRKEQLKWKEKPCAICGRPVRYHIDWEHPRSLCKHCLENKTETCLNLGPNDGKVHFLADEPLPYIGSTPIECGYSEASVYFDQKRGDIIHVTMSNRGAKASSAKQIGLTNDRLSFYLEPRTGKYIEGTAHATFKIGSKEESVQVDINKLKK